MRSSTSAKFVMGLVLALCVGCPADDAEPDTQGSTMGEGSSGDNESNTSTTGGSASSAATSDATTTSATASTTSTASGGSSGSGSSSDSATTGGSELVTCTDGGSECDDDAVCFVTRSCPPDGFCALVGWASCEAGFGSECDDPSLVCLGDGTVGSAGICVTYEFLDVLCPAQSIGCWDACPVP